MLPRQSYVRLATLVRRASTTAADNGGINRELRDVVSKQAEQQASLPQPFSVGKYQLFSSIFGITHRARGRLGTFRSWQGIIILQAVSSRLTLTKALLPNDLTYEKRVKSPYYPKRIIPTSREARHKNPFYQLDLDPRDFCMNAPLLYEFVSELGKIQTRDFTNLTARSQRLLGKAIRRAKQMGIMAIHSKPRPGRLQ